MSTRADILEALTDSPGLTLSGLTPLCKSCDGDPQIVGAMLAQLQREEVIHTAAEPKQGETVWLFGKQPVEHEYQPPITLPSPDRGPTKSAAEAAREIAAMRKGSRTGPVSCKSNSAAEEVKQEVPMKKTVVERCVEVLKKNGRMKSSELAKHAGTTVGTLYTLIGELKKKHGVVIPERGYYEIPVKYQPPPLPVDERLKRAREAFGKSQANGATFAINEHGELGIEKAEQKMMLAAEELQRLLEFMKRTQQVWEGVTA